MFCHICGTQIPEGAEFCHNCGTKVAKEVNSAAIELNTNNMQAADLFVTYKADSIFNFSMVHDQELDVFVDNIKVGSVTYGETAVYKITPGQHHIKLGLIHIQIDAPEGRNPVRLTIRSIIQEGGVIEQQLICEPSHLVIPPPQNNPGELEDLAQCHNGNSPEQYQVAKPEVIVCHRCGIELDKKADYCHKCGAKIRYREHEPRPSNLETFEKRNQSTSAGIQPHKKLECPNCHSSNLIPVSETKTDVSGGGYRAGKGCCGWILLGPLGLLCGLCGTDVKSQSKTITSWVCKDCGNKFRSPRDIEAENHSESAKNCFALLKGAGVVYIAGNLLNDHNIVLIGIPNWIYITLGAIGIILGAMWALGLGFVKILDDITYMDEADEKGYFRNSFAGSIGLIIVFLAIFMGGIISAGAEIRFFWVPAGIYILVGVLGMIASVVIMIFSWRMGLDDETAEKFDAKYGSLFEEVMRKIKRK